MAYFLYYRSIHYLIWTLIKNLRYFSIGALFNWVLKLYLKINMILQLRYVRDHKDPFAAEDFSDIRFYEIDPGQHLDLQAIIQTLKAPHNPEEAALQVFINQCYLDPDISLEKQFEENHVRDYRYLHGYHRDHTCRTY
jgi:hypothetical protein